LKILIIHSFYKLRGGEDAVFQQECAILKSRNQVEVLEYYNKPGFAGFVQFLASIWNLSAANRLRHKILEFCPDIIHIHNWHFGCGPIVIRIARMHQIPVVVTIHNYRLLCPSGTLLCNGQLFTSSLNSFFPFKAIWKRVYRNSIILTFWLALIVFVHKLIGTWAMVDRYIVLTSFSKKMFLDSNFGVPENKFIVKPNFVARNQQQRKINIENNFLFVGRLSVEKGILVALNAFKDSKINLYVAGSGPLLSQVKAFDKAYSNINYLGDLDRKEVINVMQKSAALIFPSIWFETFGLVIIEAFELGLPVIASKIGSASELVVDKFNGLHFDVGDSASLRLTLEYWQQLSTMEVERLRENASLTYERFYTPQRNIELITDLYKSLK
jgi:glycosyltransferase involved in cell wall biosynthesis